MSVGRNKAGVIELDERLYVVGGYRESGLALYSMECFDPGTNSWSSKASLFQKVESFGVN